MSKARNLSDFISDATIDSTEIADLSVTHAKLHTTMDLSSKTVTLPSAITDTITNKLPLAGGTLTGTLSAPLVVVSTSVAKVAEFNSTHTNHGYMVFKEDGADKFYLGASTAVSGQTDHYTFYTQSGIGLDFNTGGTGSPRMRIDSSGNVGIGTGSPGARLDLTVPTGDGLLINSADIATIKMKTNGGPVKNWGFATTNLAASDFGIYQSNSNGGDPITAGTARLYFNASGNVGIGTSSPDAIFTVDTNVAGASTGTIARFHSSKGESDSTFLQIAATRHPTASVQRVQLQAFDDDGSTGRTLALNSSGGNVGIGTNSPNATLTVSQSANNIFAVERTGVSSGSGQFGINVEANSQVTVSYDDGAPLVFGTASSPSTHTGFTERARIDSGGYVSMHYQPHACWRSQNSTNGNYRFPKSHQHLNTGNNLSSTGRYTCPVAGTYHFSASGFTNYNSSYGYLHLKLNGNSVHDVHWNHGPMGTGHTAISGQVTLDLSSGDYLETWQNTGSGAWIQDCISSVIFLG